MSRFGPQALSLLIPVLQAENSTKEMKQKKHEREWDKEVQKKRSHRTKIQLSWGIKSKSNI